MVWKSGGGGFWRSAEVGEVREETRNGVEEWGGLVSGGVRRLRRLGEARGRKGEGRCESPPVNNVVFASASCACVRVRPDLGEKNIRQERETLRRPKHPEP